MKTTSHSVLLIAIFTSIATSAPVPAASPNALATTAENKSPLSKHPWTPHKWFTRDNGDHEDRTSSGWEGGEFNHHIYHDHGHDGWNAHHHSRNDNHPDYWNLLAFWKQHQDKGVPGPPGVAPSTTGAVAVNTVPGTTTAEQVPVVNPETTPATGTPAVETASEPTTPAVETASEPTTPAVETVSEPTTPGTDTTPGEVSTVPGDASAVGDTS